MKQIFIKQTCLLNRVHENYEHRVFFCFQRSFWPLEVPVFVTSDLMLGKTVLLNWFKCSLWHCVTKKLLEILKHYQLMFSYCIHKDYRVISREGFILHKIVLTRTHCSPVCKLKFFGKFWHIFIYLCLSPTVHPNLLSL